MHFYRKLGFGPRLGENETDAERWIEAQLSTSFTSKGYANTDLMAISVEDWPERLNYSLSERYERSRARFAEHNRIEALSISGQEKDIAIGNNEIKYSVEHTDMIKFVQAPVVGEDHFKLRLAHFWFNHFTVGRNGSNQFGIGHFFDAAIYAKLDGTFAEMLYGVASHPAMLIYLDNDFNIGERSIRNRNCGCAGLNDNLARELLELHSVSPERNYTEDDIRDTAKILAGWGDNFQRQHPAESRIDDKWNAFFRERAEPGKKVVLGKTFEGGRDALRQLTDHLAADPMSARFLSRKLALHFIGDDATESEVGQILDAWVASGGHLPTVHRAVADVALKTESKKFLWPLTWLLQLVRMSGTHLFAGYEMEAWQHFDDGVRNPLNVLEELGMNFWSRRQPNGFSDLKSDWISTEHFDRRIRFAQMLYRLESPRRSIDDMVDLFAPSELTKNAISHARTDEDRFVILACSKEFFEV